jgi:hypothetical protein
MIMQHAELSRLREKMIWDFGNNSWKVLSMRGFYPCMHNHSINHSENILDFKEKKISVHSFESWNGEKKRKAEIGNKTNDLI